MFSFTAKIIQQLSFKKDFFAITANNANNFLIAATTKHLNTALGFEN